MTVACWCGAASRVLAGQITARGTTQPAAVTRRLDIGPAHTAVGPGPGSVLDHLGRLLGWGFAAALLPRLFGTNPRSNHKGAATGRVRTGDQRLPVLCHCQLGQDILSQDVEKSGELQYGTGKSSEATSRLEISQCICDQCLFPETRLDPKALILGSQQLPEAEHALFHRIYDDEEQLRSTVYEEIVKPSLLDLVEIPIFYILCEHSKYDFLDIRTSMEHIFIAN